MTTPSIVTGFEGWPASPTVNGGGLFNSISGSPTVGAYAHTGSNGLQINPSNATEYISWDMAAGNKIIVSSIWFKMVAAPTGGDYRLLSGSTTAGGQIFVVDTSGRLIAGQPEMAATASLGQPSPWTHGTGWISSLIPAAQTRPSTGP